MSDNGGAAEKCLTYPSNLFTLVQLNCWKKKYIKKYGFRNFHFSISQFLCCFRPFLITSNHKIFLSPLSFTGTFFHSFFVAWSAIDQFIIELSTIKTQLLILSEVPRYNVGPRATIVSWYEGADGHFECILTWPDLFSTKITKHCWIRNRYSCRWFSISTILSILQCSEYDKRVADEKRHKEPSWSLSVPLNSVLAQLPRTICRKQN